MYSTKLRKVEIEIKRLTNSLDFNKRGYRRNSSKSGKLYTINFIDKGTFIELKSQILKTFLLNSIGILPHNFQSDSKTHLS